MGYAGEVDGLIEKLELHASKLAKVQGSAVKLRSTEADLLKAAEMSRDLMHKAVGGDRNELNDVFGGSPRLDKLKDIVDVVTFSDMYRNDLRWRNLRDAIHTIEKVLEDKSPKPGYQANTHGKISFAETDGPKTDRTDYTISMDFELDIGEVNLNYEKEKNIFVLDASALTASIIPSVEPEFPETLGLAPFDRAGQHFNIIDPELQAIVFDPDQKLPARGQWTKTWKTHLELLEGTYYYTAREMKGIKEGSGSCAVTFPDGAVTRVAYQAELILHLTRDQQGCEDKAHYGADIEVVFTCAISGHKAAPFGFIATTQSLR